MLILFKHSTNKKLSELHCRHNFKCKSKKKNIYIYIYMLLTNAGSQLPAAPAATGPQIPYRYPATLSSENSSIRANFFDVVANAASFLSLLRGSPACC